MTRRMILVLFTLFSSLVVAGIASPVSADTRCGLSAPQQCALVADDAVLVPAPTAEQRRIYRVADSYYYVPASGEMWKVIHVQADGTMVIEDYVSGPPPANGIAVTPFAQRECTHPTVAFPTCYSLQDDGTWAREELAQTDTDWVIVGTVTFDEMEAAVGGVSASIP